MSMSGMLHAACILIGPLASLLNRGWRESRSHRDRRRERVKNLPPQSCVGLNVSEICRAVEWILRVLFHNNCKALQGLQCRRIIRTRCLSCGVAYLCFYLKGSKDVVILCGFHEHRPDVTIFRRATFLQETPCVLTTALLYAHADTFGEEPI